MIKIKTSELLFEHKRLNVKQDKVAINRVLNEYVYIDKKDAVGIIAIVNDEVWLVEQYRHPVNGRILEIPGGRIENNETPKEAAQRELLEETGLDATKLEYFISLFNHPSLCNDTVHIFLATEFNIKNQKLDNTESDLRIRKIKLNDIRDLLINNNIPSSRDGYVLSLLLLKNNYDE